MVVWLVECSRGCRHPGHRFERLNRAAPGVEKEFAVTHLDDRCQGFGPGRGDGSEGIESPPREVISLALFPLV
jgi:hypothetical protein